MKRIRIAFICTHNSCRSQMAEALTKLLAADVLDAYSAGTEAADRINPDAVATIKKLYNLDMEKTQHPKLLNELPPVDIAITMGCGVSCPTLPCKVREDWGLEDPTGRSRDEFIHTAKKIEQKVLYLKERIIKKEIPF